MKTLALLPALLFAVNAFAMPCDTGYTCKSASGRYVIEIQHCRYENRMGNIPTLKIDGKDAPGAKLGAAWDGATFGGFEIGLPKRGELERRLSVEWLKSSGKGTIRDESRIYDPAPYRLDRAEAISCADEG